MTLRRLLFTAAMLLWPAMVLAQDVSLSGTVTDATEAVLPGVTVTAVHNDSGNTFTAVTDPKGAYLLSGLRTGMYKVTVELPGFRSQIRDGLELQVGQHPVLNFKMALTSVSETITVTGSTPLIDTSQSKVSGNIDPRQIQEL